MTALTTALDPAFDAARAAAASADATDGLAELRDRFDLPDGVVYLDGNSLGVLPHGVAERMQRAIADEWGHGLIRSWNDAGWYPAPQRVGAQIARLVGAGATDVIACDSTSVNLYKALHAARAERPDRSVLITENDNFPTNGYIASSVAAATGMELVAVGGPDVIDAIHGAGDRAGIVALVEVNYKTGRRHDMAAITELVHQRGGVVVWDLCHSAGALPVDLAGCDVDYAVGCSYKYLNGGPGAPAFMYVNPRLQHSLRHPLTGWHGHAAPFAFDPDYRAHEGIDRLLVGTASQLGMLALEQALTAFEGVDMQAVFAKSQRMTQMFIDLVDEHLDGHGFTVVTPREPSARGSQVALTHPHGYPIIQALIDRGVIGDFRAPDILRFGFTPLYLRFVDVVTAVEVLADVMTTGAWDQPQYHARKSVT